MKDDCSETTGTPKPRTNVYFFNIHAYCIVLFQPGSFYSAKLIEETVKFSMDADDDLPDGSRQKFLHSRDPAFSRGKGDGQESSDYTEPSNLDSSSNYVSSSIDVPDGFELHAVHIDKDMADSLGISLIPCGDYLQGHFKVG